MALDKNMILWPQNEPEPIYVPYNPNAYSISKGVAWRSSGGRDVGWDDEALDRKANAPVLTFAGGGSRQLSLQLFFDATESRDEIPDVRDQTDKIVKMTRIDRQLQRPPWVQVIWGGGSDEKRKDFPFMGVITELGQQFTLFHESGRPLRALLNLTFVEFLERTDDQLETDPDLSTRVVRRGDTLPIIAAQAYGNSALWRVIAVANGIVDPLALIPGIKLVLPKL